MSKRRQEEGLNLRIEEIRNSEIAAGVLNMLGELLTSRRKSAFRAVVVILFAALLLFVGFFWIGKENVRRLRPGEVSDYEGQNLSLIDDFRENSIKGPQYINVSDYTLNLTGLVESPRTYSYDDVLNSHQHYEKVVTLHCVEGWDVTILWEGILLKDLLDEIEVKTQANTVIFYAVDGYSTSLPLSYIINNEILMAYKMNDLVLPPERGFPFQLVAESKLGYKWIKWITGIELSDNATYLGYWESRGFSNDASVP
jgi:DMSO/TMAO reductase YedYZ molybdopterin-dependent catalytic subunit